MKFEFDPDPRKQAIHFRPDRWRSSSTLLGLDSMRSRNDLRLRLHCRAGLDLANGRWTISLGLGICPSQNPKIPQLLCW